MQKVQIRDEMSSICKIDAAYRIAAENQLLSHLKELLDKSKNIAIYLSYRNEINLQSVINYCHKQKKNLYKPIAYKDTKIMRFDRHYNSVERSSHPIFYPQDYVFVAEVQVSELDLVILPVLAVDKHGYRLGRGGGYYDATFAEHRHTVLCGVGFFCQLVDHLVHDTWDVKLDYFVCEKGLQTWSLSI